MAVELENQNLKEESKSLNIELETASKSIMDKERSLKQLRNTLVHHDNVSRTNKTKLQEYLEKITEKET